VSISQEELFRIALGLEKPWYIKNIEFKVEEKQLDLYLDFESGSKFPCPTCSPHPAGRALILKPFYPPLIYPYRK